MEKSSLIDEGMVVGAFTLGSYIIAFKYESGFCSYWSIPSYFVEISLTAVVAAGLSFLFFLLSIFLIMNLPVSLLNRELADEDSFRRKVIISHLGIFAVWLAFIFGYGFSFLTFFFLVFIVVFDSLFLLVPWWIDKRVYDDELGFFERVVRARENSHEEVDLFRWTYSLIGAKPYFILLVILPLVSMVSSAAGASAARNTHRFLVIESQDLVLIRKYGDTYLLRSIDLAKGEIGGDVVAWKSEDIAKHRFTSRFFKRVKISKKDESS